MSRRPSIRNQQSKSLSAFRELDASQAAMYLSAEIYVLTHVTMRTRTRIAAEEIRRAADALPAALVRGQAVNGIKELGYHMSKARVLVAELEGLLMLGEECGDFTSDQLRHVFSLMRYIKNYCSMHYMMDDAQQRTPQLAS